MQLSDRTASRTVEWGASGFAVNLQPHGASFLLDERVATFMRKDIQSADILSDQRSARVNGGDKAVKR